MRWSIFRRRLTLFIVTFMTLQAFVFLTIRRPSTTQDRRSGPELVQFGSNLETSFDVSFAIGDNSTCHTIEQQGSRSEFPTRPFDLCLQKAGKDLISDRLRSENSWEADITALLYKALKKVDDKRAVFLDVGANLGIHSVFIAANDFPVIAVEPTWVTLAKLYKSVTLLGPKADSVTIVANAVSSERKVVTMSAMKGNFGGARIDDNDQRGQKVETILLADIFDRLISKDKDAVIIKMDIEGYECDAILGSENVISDYDISLVVMEWRFRAAGFSGPCPPEKRQRVAKVFTSNGFEPRSIDLETELDADEAPDWPVMDMVWLKRSI